MNSLSIVANRPRTRRRRHTTIGAATASAALLLLAACSGGFGGGGGSSTTIVAAVGTNPPNFNRNLTTDIAASDIGPEIYEPLVAINQSYKPVPRLAKSWSISNHGTTYTFKLQPNVKWQDGKPFTSADVAMTLKRFVPLNATASLWSNLVKSVETPDSQTVVLHLEKPYDPMLNSLASVWIMPAHIYDSVKNIATAPQNQHPIGTGPYKLSQFIPQSRVVLTRYEGYWGTKPIAKKIIWQIVPDANSLLLSLKSGQVDAVASSYISNSAIAGLKSNAKFKILKSPSGISTTTVQLNTRKGPLAKVSVRKALYQAIDRQSIVKKAFYGLAAVSRGPIPAGFSWAVTGKVNFNKEYPYNLQQAAAALDSAGYPMRGGHRFSLTLTFPNQYPLMVSTANLIKSDLARVGVDVNLVGQDFDVWTQQTFENHNFDMSLVFYTSYEDPSLGVARIYLCNPSSTAFRNPSGYCSGTIDAAFGNATTAPNLTGRAQAFQEAERLISQLLYNYPLVTNSDNWIERADRWDFSEANQEFPMDWSKVRRVG